MKKKITVTYGGTKAGTRGKKFTATHKIRGLKQDFDRDLKASANIKQNSVQVGGFSTDGLKTLFKSMPGFKHKLQEELLVEVMRLLFIIQPDEAAKWEYTLPNGDKSTVYGEWFAAEQEYMNAGYPEEWPPGPFKGWDIEPERVLGQEHHRDVLKYIEELGSSSARIQSDYVLDEFSNPMWQPNYTTALDDYVLTVEGLNTYWARPEEIATVSAARTALEAYEVLSANKATLVPISYALEELGYESVSQVPDNKLQALASKIIAKESNYFMELYNNDFSTNANLIYKGAYVDDYRFGGLIELAKQTAKELGSFEHIFPDIKPIKDIIKGLFEVINQDMQLEKHVDKVTLPQLMHLQQIDYTNHPLKALSVDELISEWYKRDIVRGEHQYHHHMFDHRSIKLTVKGINSTYEQELSRLPWSFHKVHHDTIKIYAEDFAAGGDLDNLMNSFNKNLFTRGGRYTDSSYREFFKDTFDVNFEWNILTWKFIAKPWESTQKLLVDRPVKDITHRYLWRMHIVGRPREDFTKATFKMPVALAEAVKTNPAKVFYDEYHYTDSITKAVSLNSLQDTLLLSEPLFKNVLRAIWEGYRELDALATTAGKSLNEVLEVEDFLAHSVTHLLDDTCRYSDSLATTPTRKLSDVFAERDALVKTANHLLLDTAQVYSDLANNSFKHFKLRNYYHEEINWLRARMLENSLRFIRDAGFTTVLRRSLADEFIRLSEDLAKDFSRDFYTNVLADYTSARHPHKEILKLTLGYASEYADDWTQAEAISSEGFTYRVADIWLLSKLWIDNYSMDLEKIDYKISKVLTSPVTHTEIFSMGTSKLNSLAIKLRYSELSTKSVTVDTWNEYSTLYMLPFRIVNRGLVENTLEWADEYGFDNLKSLSTPITFEYVLAKHYEKPQWLQPRSLTMPYLKLFQKNSGDFTVNLTQVNDSRDIQKKTAVRLQQHVAGNALHVSYIDNLDYMPVDYAGYYTNF